MYSGRVGVDDNFTMMPKITTADTNSYTKLLCHFDTDGTDSSVYNRTPTSLLMGATISNSWSKFGGGSLDMPRGTTALVIATHSYSYPYSTDFIIGTNDFTIEAWVYITSATSTNSEHFVIYSKGDIGYLLFYVFTGSIYFYSSSLYIFTTGFIVGDSTWNHIAISRTSGVVKLFLNGVSQSYATSYGSGTADIPDVAGPEYVGSNAEIYTASGYLDEFRFTNGIGRYPTNFTPATAPF